MENGERSQFTDEDRLGVAQTTMKEFVIILILAAVFSVTYAARPANSSLELVLSDDRVVFTTATNISVEMVFRNVGETNIIPMSLLEGLSVVFDGKEHQQDPRRAVGYNGVLIFQPKSGWRSRISFSDFLIPPEALTFGRHTVELRDAGAQSNAQTIFIEPRK